jgi:hypothetical protein
LADKTYTNLQNFRRKIEKEKGKEERNSSAA